MTLSAGTRSSLWREAPLIAALLVGFFFLLVFSVWEKSVTADEIPHALGGYTAWAFNDYRFNPENGNVPQRLIGLPFWLVGTHFPATAGVDWDKSNEWTFGDRWFHETGNEVSSLLRRGRGSIAVVTVALAGLVWWWSRRLFGPRGAIISLLLCVLDPTLLAHGALMTSDVTAAFFFLAVTWTIWNLLQLVTPARVLISAVLLGLLFGSKMSAPLILVITAILTAVRLIRNEPLAVKWLGTHVIASRQHQALIFLAIFFVHLVVAWAVVWSLFGFRYSTFSTATGREQPAQAWELVLNRSDPLAVVKQVALTPEQTSRLNQILLTLAPSGDAWSSPRLQAAERIEREILTPDQRRQLPDIAAASPRSRVDHFIDSLREHHVLPEAFLYGYAHVWKFSQMRTAFLNGKVSLTGWSSFFPYAFLVKTPLSTLGLIALGVVALLLRHRRRSRSFNPARSIGYDVLPLLLLVIVYFSLAMTSHLNIGHRHLVTIYPPLFILAGATAAWLPDRWTLSRGKAVASESLRTWTLPALAVFTLLLTLAVETLTRFPNYLAYFNPIAGGSNQGYRHLVDSSLDWGQELPAIARYLERNRGDQPVYLSYFGRGDPLSYGISAHGLYAYESDVAPPPLIARSYLSQDAPMQLREFLHRHPDYALTGSAHMPDGTVVAVMLKKVAAWRLTGGLYLISATMLQPLAFDLDGPLGAWNERYERLYQELRQETSPFLNDDPTLRAAALGRRPLYEWARILKRFEAFRFARLTAWLRQRDPYDEINHSVLVYRLTDADLIQALNGPPPELGNDLPAEYAKTHGALGGTE